ncbi:MAG: ABC transporter ATP-binding protein [Clostridiales bacterium]|nr:ABC transporter ATP-binding protein [Clostridiales bacterium]
MNVIEIRNLTKYYGKSRGIIDVSFDVHRGEIFGFIGPNGAGKSTTIRTLLALIYPSSGSASIFGRDCITEGHEIRKTIGYLPSEVFYYDNMRVIDLLKYSAGFYKNVDRNRIYELAEIMDLDLKKKIDDLSYGNKKKVGIVQGLLHKPELIILDEPTGGLDPLMQQKFFDLIREENRKGATILFSSHILSEVQKLCNRVGIIKEGRMIKVEEISTLQNTSYKSIRLELSEAADNSCVQEAESVSEAKIPDTKSPEAIKAFAHEYFRQDGITKLFVSNHTVEFLYKGDINQIISLLHGLNIKNLSVEEPSLEDIFMHYYEKEA